MNNEIQFGGGGGMHKQKPAPALFIWAVCDYSSLCEYNPNVCSETCITPVALLPGFAACELCGDTFSFNKQTEWSMSMIISRLKYHLEFQY